MAERDDLDRLLDAALSTYADPGPGLEARVLERIRTFAPVRSLRPQGWWATGLAMAAAILLFFAFPARWHRPLAPKPNSAMRASSAVAPTTPNKVATPPPSAPRPHQGARLHAAAPVAPPPKLDTFPSPAPLSAEEESLLRLVMQSSESERQALLTAQQQSDAPIHISAISIPPIPPPAEGQE